MTAETNIRSANIHVIGKCNYRCEHCFDRCLTHSHMKPENWLGILEEMKSRGIEKINIAGGEPMLYPYLDEMCRLIKGMGFILSIISNGSLITEKWISEMKDIVDWIGLSIDSPYEDDEIKIGRHIKNVNHLDNVIKVSEIAHKCGIKVKLNITVVRKTWMRDFKPFIDSVKPERVKVFRVLTLRNANDDIPDVWSITDKQFADFKSRHDDIEGIVFEDNDDMIDSYLMFDPIGKWMVNKGGEIRFLPYDTFQRDGMKSNIDVSKYYSRNAVYNWCSDKTPKTKRITQ